MYKNCIRVYCRLKPNFEESYRSGIKYQIVSDVGNEEDYEILVVRSKPSSAFINHKPDSYSFRFHKIFDEDTSQEEIYNTVAKPVIEGVLRGYNGTIFAYGQTGSGKTFTISGNAFDETSEAIVHHSLRQIFQQLERRSSRDYRVDVSFMEIYNENGCDLISDGTDRRIILQEDEDGEIQLRNLSLHNVRNYKDFLRLYKYGENNRSESNTLLNQYSSRSHCILTVHLTVRLSHSEGFHRSKLHLVDLAGSERISKSGGNQTVVEARHINLSLHYLEQVIVALGEKHRIHIPYRNSMMTTVLRDSLGGNCFTAMIATLATNSNNLAETLSTCRFAQRVALVRNEARLNVSDESTELDFLRAEFQSLKKQMSESLLKSVIVGFKKKIGENLSEEESLECQNFVDNFIHDNNFQGVMRPIIKNPKKIKVCFEIFKSLILDIQKKRMKAENQAHFIYQKVLESKGDGLLSPRKSNLSHSKCLLSPRKANLSHSKCSLYSKNSLLRLSSNKINTGLRTSTDSIDKTGILSPRDTRTELKEENVLQRKRPHTCADGSCISRDILKERLNNLTNVIEECKEVHKKELNKLDSIRNLMLDNFIKTHTSLTDIMMKMNKEKLSRLCITKTESMSNLSDEIDSDKNDKRYDLNKEVLLTFDASQKYGQRSSKDVISYPFDNIDNEDVGFYGSTSEEYPEKDQTILSKNKNIPSSSYKNTDLPRYSRNNPEYVINSLITSSEPVIKYNGSKSPSVYDKNEIKSNINPKTQRLLATQSLKRTSQRDILSGQRKFSQKRSILTNSWFESKGKGISESIDVFSHCEGNPVRDHECGDMTNKHLSEELTEAKKNEVKHSLENNHYRKLSSSSKGWLSFQQTHLPITVMNNCCDTSKRTDYCCTCVLNCASMDKKIEPAENNYGKKMNYFHKNDSCCDGGLNNMNANIDFDCGKKSDYCCRHVSMVNEEKIVNNDNNLEHTPQILQNSQNFKFVSVSNCKEENIGNIKENVKIPVNKSSSTTTYSSEQEFSDDDYGTSEEDNDFINLKPGKALTQNKLKLNSDSQLYFTKSGKNCDDIRKKLSETLPLTGDPEIDEEIISFYEKQSNYSS